MPELKINDAAELQFMWATGKTPSGQKVELKDALSTSNAPIFFPQVIQNIVKEAAEPLLIGTSLLQRINYAGKGSTIVFGATGGLVAADIAEGQEYPIRQLSSAGGTMTATIGKSGLAVQVTEEMIRYSQFDVIGMHLRAAGRALARHKEVKIFNMIRNMGVRVFDNLAPTNSLLGVCTGRDFAGQANGSITLDDIFDAYAQVLTQGFMPDTLLLHPLTWCMFVKDPILRAFVLANGGGSFFATWSGNPAGRAPWDNSSQGGMGVSGGQNIIPGQTSTGGAQPNSSTPSGLLSFPQDINSAPVLPSYMNVPLRIIVSPFVNFDPRRKLTDVYLFDSRELGALVVDEEITTEKWNDPSVDIMKIKLRERYAIAILQEGKAIAQLRNVHVVPNEIVLPAQATIQVSSSMSKISPTQSIAL
jgi:hypothetical protein